MADTTGAGASAPFKPASAELANASPSEVLHYFNLDRDIKISNTVGTDFGRLALFLFLVAVMSLLFPIGMRATSYLSNNLLAQLLAGTALWLVGFAGLLYLHVISVPEITGLVTLSVLTGTMHAYGAGWKIRYLWEQVKEENFINLRLIPTNKTFKFVTKDGVEVQYTFTVQYRGRLNLLPVFIRVDKADIDEAIHAIVRSVVAISAMDRTADEQRIKANVELLLKDLRKELGQDDDGVGHEIEYRYGIDIEVVSLSEPTFGEDYVQATTAEVITGKFNAAALKLKQSDGLGLTGQSAMDTVLLANKEKIERKVTGIEAADLADKIGGALQQGFAAIVATLGKRS